MADLPTTPTRLLEIRAAIAAIVVGVLLMAVKFVAYYVTRSAAVLSDALESIVNVLASGMAFYSVWLAHRPADREHPYGHGKIEFMAAGFEGGLICAAAVLIVVKAVYELATGRASVQAVGLGWPLVAGAMVVNGTVGSFLLVLGRRCRSLTLEADGRHLLSDAVTSLVALIALAVVAWTGWLNADPLAALLIALYIAWTGLGLLRRSAAGLMDEQDADDDRLATGILDRHTGPHGDQPRICSYHKLRHRHTGRFHWVDFHVVLPAGLTIEDGHRVASLIETEMEQALGEADATAHVEPCDQTDCSNCSAQPPSANS